MPRKTVSIHERMINLFMDLPEAERGTVLSVLTALHKRAGADITESAAPEPIDRSLSSTPRPKRRRKRKAKVTLDPAAAVPEAYGEATDAAPDDEPVPA